VTKNIRFAGIALIIFNLYFSSTVKEGSHLFSAGVNPYDGDVYHENPIVLYITTLLISHCPQVLHILYIFLDISTGVLLFLAATKFVKMMFDQQTAELKYYAPNTAELHIKHSDLENIPLYVAIAYLLNPYSILNCVGQTTTVWSNFLLALYFFGLSRRLKVLTCLALALEVQRNLYPFVLIVPAVFMFSEQRFGKKVTDVTHGRFAMVTTTLLFGLILGGLYYVSFLIAKDWKFFDSTLGFM
jgi:GPI-anchor transamidase subunit U